MRRLNAILCLVFICLSCVSLAVEDYKLATIDILFALALFLVAREEND